MFNFIKNLFKSAPEVDYKALIKNGAQIIDVRTVGEFQSGHIKGSVNMPLQDLQQYLKKIKKDKPVITCCASGMRSASAKSLLQSQGFHEVYNGGGWNNLQSKL